MSNFIDALTLVVVYSVICTEKNMINYWNYKYIIHVHSKYTIYCAKLNNNQYKLNIELYIYPVVK